VDRHERSTRRDTDDKHAGFFQAKYGDEIAK